MKGIRILYAALMFGFAYGGEPILFSETRDIKTLPVKRKAEGKLLARDNYEERTFHIDPSDCVIYPAGENYQYLKVENLPPSGMPGEPRLPMMTMVVKLPKNSVISEVELVKGSYVDIKNKLKIVPVPQAVIWNNNYNSYKVLVPDEKVYASNSLFPGRFVSFDSGSDNENVYCFVKIFPVQYIPKQGTAILLTDAELRIWYVLKDGKYRNTKGILTDAVSLIITANEFISEAASLKAFHQERLGMMTEVVTTEWISGNYAPADDPSYPGYANTDPGDVIEGYDYDLAKRIIQYLRDDDAHPNLEYITILGDAAVVPPSYYFSFWDELNWVPSDYLYGSPDYDYILNYKVGRISVSDTLDALHYVDKIKRWYENLDQSWFSNLTVAGGRPFDTRYYHGELIANDVINRNFLNRMNITKKYWTDNNFNRQDVLPIFQNGGLGISYIISHGSGYAIYFDDNSEIDTTDLLGFSDVTNLPVVVSIACTNGAFDTDLVPYLDLTTSFGEAILRSRAGGIAYIGGARLNAGVASFHFEDGNLTVDKEWYMAGMLTYSIGSYHNGAGTLGELTKVACDSFVANNNLSIDWLNQETLFEFVLLGDPVLPVLPQGNTAAYKLPSTSAQNPTYINSDGIPIYIVNEVSSITLNSSTNSPSVWFKLIEPNSDDVIETVYDAFPPFEYSFSVSSGYHPYLLRTSTEDGKERWFCAWVTTDKIVPDGDMSDWEIAGIEPVGHDSSGDFNPEDLDVTNLYITNDKTNLYIGFDAKVETADMAYGIAIDCKDGGYIGTQGISQDAGSNWITFGENHPVDYELYFFHYPEESSFWVELYKWEDIYWHYFTYIDEDSFGFSYNGDFFEVAIPLSLIDNPSSISLVLFSTYSSNNPAQDASPSDDATYNYPHYGQEWANTLTNFATVDVTGVEENQPHSPIPRINLLQCKPNPFTLNTSIKYQLPVPADVKLKIYNTTGRLVRTLVNNVQGPGSYTVYWDGRDKRGRRISEGLYFIRLDTENRIIIKKILMLR